MKLQLSYTDLIAITIKEHLQEEFASNMVVNGVKWDLHPEEGYYLSSKKTISVKYLDKRYKITIEENDN
jgi:hypothetical protein